MKNNHYASFSSSENSPTNLFSKIMKITIFLFCFCAFNAIAGNVNSQNAKVSIKKANVPLEEILSEIENQTDYLFMYSDAINTKQRTSIKASNRSVAEVLKELFEGKVAYEMEGNHIILSSRTKETGSVQQDKNGIVVTGQVVDESGTPIIGATLQEKGVPVNGAITDIDGNFSIKVSKGAVLQVSYIGYTSKEIAVGTKTVINIVLKENSEALEEVVVVGYGTQKKINLSGAVASVDNKMLANRPVQNLSSALQGLMPGVNITSNGGKPGMDGATIRIRGVGTLNNASPYILVDGVETGTMNSIDPNDIENISVLKDASSAAIYGSKASNGVILITTKRGKAGKTSVSYSGNIGIQQPTNTVERLSSYEYASLLSRSMKEIGMEPRFTDEEIQKFKDGNDPNYPNTQWYDLILRTGFQHTHNVNVNGGSENVKFMASLGYLGQEGILAHSDRKQMSARANLDMRLSSRITARMNMSYIRNNYSDPTSTWIGGGSGIIFTEANRLAPWIVGRREDGSYGTNSDGNPLAWLDLGQTQDRNNRNFSGTVAIDYELLDGLKLTVNGTYVDNGQRYSEFLKHIEYNPNHSSEPNRLTIINYDWERSVFNALANYDKQFGNHGLKIMAGWQAEKYDYTEDSAFRKNFPTNDLSDMNAGEQKTQTNGGYTRELAMLSYFARVNYDFSGKYLLEANVRADASSRFAPGHRWGYFPSFSAAWRISEENFMERTKGWLDSMKIRASWGLLGNQDALSDYYSWMATYGVGSSYPFGGELSTGYYLGGYKVPTISWEKSRTWGIGLDATLFKNVNLSVDYYNRKTTGIIMDMPTPDEFALGGYKDNVGAMNNQGVEVTLSYNNRWGDWTFGAMGNISYNKNELLDLGGVTSMVDPNNNKKRREVGQRLNSYYMYATDGFFQSDEEAKAWMDKYAGKPGYPFGSKQFKGGDLIYRDANGDGLMTDEDRVLCGSSDPSFNFGLNLNAGYKGFDCTLMFTGVAGKKMLLTDNAVGSFIGDGTHPASVWLDAWTPENKNAKMPRVAYGTESPSSFQYVASDFWLNDASYLRLKNLQVGYTFPKKWLNALGVSNLRLYYSVENVFTISKMLINVDPEITSESAADYPLLRTHSFGLTLSF